MTARLSIQVALPAGDGQAVVATHGGLHEQNLCLADVHAAGAALVQVLASA
jgi:hypothetical protein